MGGSLQEVCPRIFLSTVGLPREQKVGAKLDPPIKSGTRSSNFVQLRRLVALGAHGQHRVRLLRVTRLRALLVPWCPVVTHERLLYSAAYSLRLEGFRSLTPKHMNAYVVVIYLALLHLQVIIKQTKEGEKRENLVTQPSLTNHASDNF